MGTGYPPYDNQIGCPYCHGPIHSGPCFPGQWDHLNPRLDLTPMSLHDPNLNWKQLATDMKRGVRPCRCSHTNSRRGFWQDKWGCNRKIRSDDLCESNGKGRGKCAEWLMNRFSVDREDAMWALTRMRECGHVTIYNCGRVFFHV